MSDLPLIDEAVAMITRRRLASAKDAIITVGAGRGFLVEARRRRLVITAAHCLPHLPPAHPAAYAEELTYQNLLGPLGEPATVSAECRFVDPIADVAVMVTPDPRSFWDESEAYARLVEDRRVMKIGKVRQAAPAWLLTLDGQWELCSMDSRDFISWLLITNTPRAAYAPGTSGSPIVAINGRVIGLVSVGDHLNPILATSLPGRLFAVRR